VEAARSREAFIRTRSKDQGGKDDKRCQQRQGKYTVRAVTIEASLDVKYAHLGYGFVVIR
jgi:hypothetical protein